MPASVSAASWLWAICAARGDDGLGTMWDEELADAGFTAVEVRQLEHDIANSYYIARPGAII